MLELVARVRMLWCKTFRGSNNTVRAYCLDIPRFEESLKTQTQYKPHSRNKVYDSNNGYTVSLKSLNVIILMMCLVGGMMF